MDFHDKVAEMLTYLEQHDDEKTEGAMVDALMDGLATMLATACCKEHFVERTNTITAEVRQRAAYLFIKTNNISMDAVMLAASQTAGGMH